MWSEETRYLIDSGSSITISGKDKEPFLYSKRISKLLAECANGGTLKGRWDGTLKLLVADNYKSSTTNISDLVIPAESNFEIDTVTAKEAPVQLFSINNTVHNKKMDVLFTDKPGESKIYNKDISIPIIYDPYEQGWYLHCLIDKSPAMKNTVASCTIKKGIYTEFENRIQELRVSENQYIFPEGVPQYSEGKVAMSIMTLKNHPMVRAVHNGPTDGSKLFSLWSRRLTRKVLSLRNRTMSNIKLNNSPEMGDQPSGAITGTSPRIKMKEYKKLDQSKDEEDGWIRYYLGTKQKLGKKAAWSALKFHEHHCHPGNHEDCPHCKNANAGRRRQYKQVDPHIPSRRGEVFYVDGTTYPIRSFQDAKYSIVLRDPMSKYFGYIPIIFRSEAPYAIESWIQTLRSDPIFRTEGYDLCSRIILDLGGEWNDESKEWTDMCERMKIRCTWISPDTKSGKIERPIGIIEAHINATLMSQNLPKGWWQRAGMMVTYFLNRFPCENGSIDGDWASPIEILSNGRYSRRQVEKELKYAGPPGMLALVHDVRIKGSDLASRSRWGVLIGMIGDLNIWEDPFTAARFKCKSYTVVDLQPGVNYYQLLGIDYPDPKWTSQMTKDDIEDNKTWVINLPDPLNHQKNNHPPIVSFETRKPDQPLVKLKIDYDNLDSQVEKAINGPPLLIEDRVRAWQEGPSDVKRLWAPGKMGPPVHQLIRRFGTDKHGKVVADEVIPHGTTELKPSSNFPKTELTMTFYYKGPPCPGQQNDLLPIHECADPLAESEEITGSDTNWEKYIGRTVIDDSFDIGSFAGLVVYYWITDDGSIVFRVHFPDGDFVDYSISELRTKLTEDTTRYKPPTEWNIAPDGRGRQTEDYTTGDKDTFFQVCRRMDIPRIFYKRYYESLPSKLKESIPNPFQKGKGRRPHLAPGLTFPGVKESLSVEWLNNKARRLSILAAGQLDLDNTFMTETVINDHTRSVGHRKPQVYLVHIKTDTVKYEGDMLEVNKALAAKVRKNITVREALNSAEYKLYIEAWDTEIKTLEDMKAVSHGHTLTQLREMGITGKPIPSTMLGTKKYDTEGNFTRAKGRWVVQGTKKNVQKGVHYEETHASTPTTATTRITQALATGYNHFRMAFDIAAAFLWASRGDDLIAIKYPPGFRRFDPITYEELYLVVTAGLYGLPDSPRRFMLERNEFVLTFFNRNGFSCRKSLSDPSLMIITRKKSDKKIYSSSGKEIKAAVEETRQIRKLNPLRTPGPGRGEKIKRDEPKGQPRKKDIAQAKGVRGPTTLAECLSSQVAQTFADAALAQPEVRMPDMAIDFDTTDVLYLIFHVDDGDVTCSNPELAEYVYRVFDEQYRCKKVDPAHMLGINRKLTTDANGVRTLNINQEFYITELYERFKKDIPQKIPDTPFPPNQYMDKSLGGRDPEEIKRNIDRNFMGLVGGLLWAARHTAIECQLGVNMICSVMATPSDLAWRQALHLLSWMFHNRRNGIEARSDSNPEPIAFTDSGWRPQAVDGKSQYGFVIYLFGMPVVWVSKKLPHLSVSTPHSEFMAIALCAREVIWIRQLMTECGITLSAPTPVYGDNSVANMQVSEDFTTSKNKFCFLPYQLVKWENGKSIVVIWVPTHINLADILTKSVPREVIVTLLPALQGRVLVDWQKYFERVHGEKGDGVPIVAMLRPHGFPCPSHHVTRGGVT